jgi:hypothetical protein
LKFTYWSPLGMILLMSPTKINMPITKQKPTTKCFNIQRNSQLAFITFENSYDQTFNFNILNVFIKWKFHGNQMY